MKNVHLITKEQEGADVLHQYLYITSNEEIKQGDRDFYILANDRDGTWINRVEKVIECKIDPNHGKVLILSSGFIYIDEGCKIILTDNPDLIADGVQPIDNDFLEWFVKNPSCERVEVEIIEVEDYVGFAGHTSYPTFHNEYKIIIPQEEPKQIKCYCGHTITCDCEPKQEEPNKTHYLDELPNMDKKVLAKMWESAMPKLEPKQEISDEAKERAKNYMRLKGALEPKQETLEEVRKVERSDLYNKIHSIVKQIPREDVETDAMDASSCAYDIEQLFYKWQKEKSYSEEEVLKILHNYRNHFELYRNIQVLPNMFFSWFEQQKKK